MKGFRLPVFFALVFAAASAVYAGSIARSTPMPGPSGRITIRNHTQYRAMFYADKSYGSRWHYKDERFIMPGKSVDFPIPEYSEFDISADFKSENGSKVGGTGWMKRSLTKGLRLTLKEEAGHFVFE